MIPQRSFVVATLALAAAAFCVSTAEAFVVKGACVRRVCVSVIDAVKGSVGSAKAPPLVGSGSI